jgi:hypothetical protein
MVVSLGDVLGLAVIEGLWGLVLLTILWPNRRSGIRLLGRWGVADPTEAELAEALTYLRRRRFWYPWLFLGLGFLVDSTSMLPSNQNDEWSIPAVLLLGALLAELFAQRRSPAPVRVAIPVRRGLTDIVPGWALVLHAVAALAAVVLLGGALAGLGWARHWYPNWSARILWIALGGAVLSVVAVWVIVGLALRRPAVAELRIDPLLRTRSARVPVGLGIATLCALIGGGESAFRGMIIIVAGLFCWVVITGPVRKPTPVPA